MAHFIPQELIRKKRDGGALSEAELQFMVHGFTDGGLSEGQVAAFAMAVFFRGMNGDERVAPARHLRCAVDAHRDGGGGDGGDGRVL